MFKLHLSALGDTRSNALPAKPQNQPPKGAQVPGAGTAKAAVNEYFMSISQDATNMLEAQKAADQEKKRQAVEAKREADQERMQKAIEDSEAQRAGLRRLDNDSRQEALKRRVGDIKQRLDRIKEAMRSALMWGDKRWAVMLAKEAAQLAKDLAAAIRSSGINHPPQADGSVSAPSVSGGEGEGQADGSEGVENAVNVETEAPEADTEASGAEEAEARTAAAEAERQAAEAGLKPEDVEEEDDQGDAGKDPLGDKKPPSPDGQTIKDRLEAARGASLDKASQASQPSRVAWLKKAVDEIRADLKEIMSMAKQIVRQKTHPLGLKEDPKKVQGYQEDVEKVEKDIAKTFREIDAMIADAEAAEAAETGIAAVVGAVEAVVEATAEVPVEALV